MKFQALAKFGQECFLFISIIFSKTFATCWFSEIDHLLYYCNQVIFVSHAVESRPVCLHLLIRLVSLFFFYCETIRVVASQGICRRAPQISRTSQIVRQRACLLPKCDELETLTAEAGPNSPVHPVSTPSYALPFHWMHYAQRYFRS
jgi:hypothetical protein